MRPTITYVYIHVKVGREEDKSRGVDEDGGDIGSHGRVGHFQLRPFRVVDNKLPGGLTISRWKVGQIHQRPSAECPGISWQVQMLGTGEKLILSEILREGTRLEANWGIWVKWTSFVVKGCGVRKDMGGMELVKMVKFMRYCCAMEGNNGISTIVGKLVAISLYHEQFVVPSVPMSNPLIRSVWKGIKRAHL